MGKTWSDDAARYLVDWTSCPRCDARLDPSGWCPNCGADVSGPIASELAEASMRTVEALKLRQSIVDRLPTIQATTVPPAAESSSGAMIAAVVPPLPLPEREGSSSEISVQSVLAIAGAGLLAVAAIVFTFLNPDLTEFGTRTTIVAAITIVFLGGAWFLAKKRLQFSAEAIGALGAVFVVLDIWALSQIKPTEVSGWVYGGLGTLLSSAVMFVIAIVARVRTWLWAAFLGLALTPALFSYAAGNPWVATLGHLAVGFVALGMHRVARGLQARFDSPLAADRGTASVIQILVLIVVLIQLATLHTPTSFARALGSAAIFGILALFAALSTKNELAGFWSFAMGALSVAAVGVLPFAIGPGNSVWYVGLVPVAAALALAALAAMAATPRLATIRRTAALSGGWAVASLGAVPAVLIAVLQIVIPLANIVPAEFGLAAILGLAGASAGSWGLSRLARRIASADDGRIHDRPEATPTKAGLVGSARAIALWIGMLALVTVTGWSALPRPGQVAVGLIIALGLSVLLARVPGIAGSPSLIRGPLIAGAHALVFLVAVIAWAEPIMSIIAGAAVASTIIVVAQMVPRRIRPLHVAVGYAYALVIFATALKLANVDTVAVLCLTTSVASSCALAATAMRRLRIGFWYAILIVTAIPFLLGIVSVLLVRSGWTALSTAVTFALALTLLLTRRPGLNRIVRTAAAALLVPALAVVVICLGAQLLSISGSPVALPVIAAIVACTLPGTGRIEAALARRGLSPAEARSARIWIEISSLVTAVLAVVLALVRSAAGLGTAFLVLVILGLGAAAAAVITRRQYAWAVAGVSWTGALWCIWGLLGVQVLELYILPPALAAAVIGAVFVTRGLPGFWFYATGLAFAALPSLTILAVSGFGPAGTGQWRAYGLLVGALLLLVIGAVVTRLPRGSALGKLGRLQVPTLIAAIAAAAGGVVQAVRYGWALDPNGLDHQQLLMLPVLGFSIVATVFAATAAALLVGAFPKTTDVGNVEQPRISRSRWLYVPACLYLVVGPMTAIRQDWLSILTLWALTIVLLTTMLVTVARSRQHVVRLPPVWFMFALAWCTAVVGWSERALRVEVFSLPLGFALLAAGIIAMRRSKEDVNAAKGRIGITSWPIGFTGSWRLLAPGIVVTFLPSVLSTGTDPLTWRAILVIVFALIAILIGSLRKLGAPFILGIVVLPIENVIVFVVQIGRSIGAAPWWITLATAGAVLLVIAVTYERRTANVRGVSARLRDLQ